MMMTTTTTHYYHNIPTLISKILSSSHYNNYRYATTIARHCYSHQNHHHHHHNHNHNHQYRLFSGRNNNKKKKTTPNEWQRRWNNDIYVKKSLKQGLPSRAIFKLEQMDNAVAKKQQQQQQKQQQQRQRKRQRGDGGGGEQQHHHHHRGGIFQPGYRVVDLGASPGSWSLYASKKIGPRGYLIAVDLLPLSSSSDSRHVDFPADRFSFIRGDFRDDTIKLQIATLLLSSSSSSSSDDGGATTTTTATSETNDCKAHVIMSDMAPNFSGDKSTDALRTMRLCEEALSFAVGGGDHHRSSSSSSSSTGGLLAPGGTFLCKFFSCGKENELDLKMMAREYFGMVDIAKPHASRKESAEIYLVAREFLRRGGE